MFTVIPQPPQPALEGVVYTDGATSPNPGPSGYGIYAKDSHGIEYDIWCGFSKNASNNRAEMSAYIKTLQLAQYLNWTHLIVHSDSEYVVKGAKERMRRYQRNGWYRHDGSIVPNRDLWEEMIREEDAFKSRRGATITLKWVKAHSGIDGNERADKLAVKGRLSAEKGILTHDVKITEPSPDAVVEDAPKKKKPSDYPRLLAGRRFMFVTKMDMRTDDGWRVYLTNAYEDGSGKNGRYCGKPDANNMQSVVLTREPIPQIDAIVEYQNHITPDDYNTPVVGMLDRIVRPDMWEMLTEHGGSLLRHQRLNVLTSEREPLTEYRRPPRLAFDEIDRLQVLLEHLTRFRKNDLCPTQQFDITDWIYGLDKKNKRKLHADIGGQAKYITVKVKVGDREVPLKLTLGIDLPPRVNLSGIIKQHEDIQISVILYAVTPAAFRYAVVFNSADHCAIYASMSANFKPLVKSAMPLPTKPEVVKVPTEEAPKPKRKKKKKRKSKAKAKPAT